MYHGDGVEAEGQREMERRWMASMLGDAGRDKVFVCVGEMCG
jgi:hypothetical protein